MNRPVLSPTLLATSALLVVVLAVALGALARPSAAEDPPRPHHVVYLHVSGQGPQTKAWYDGGPPSGTSVQAALNHFAAQGYRFAAVASSGSASLTQVVGTTTSSPTPDGVREPFFVVLLER
jgi:hypothetical protein